jgi:hypothetical protein
MRMLEIFAISITSTLLCVLVYVLYKLVAGPQDGDHVVLPTELHEIDQWEIERRREVDQWERWRKENER